MQLWGRFTASEVGATQRVAPTDDSGVAFGAVREPPLLLSRGYLITKGK